MSINQELTALVQRLEAVATRLEGTQGGSSGQVVEGKVLVCLLYVCVLS